MENETIETVTARLSADEKRNLKTYCASKNITIQDLLERLLRPYTKEV